jgi:hypothetical protein
MGDPFVLTKDMGKLEIEAFLSHLATNRKVAASTQRRAQSLQPNKKKHGAVFYD